MQPHCPAASRCQLTGGLRAQPRTITSWLAGPQAGKAALLSPTTPSPSAGSPWRLGVQRGEYLGHNPLRSKSTYSAVLQGEPQMLCTQKVGPVRPSDHREAGPGEGYATTWPAREGVLASLSTQSSFPFTKPLPKARILPAHLCIPLGWALGVRRNSDPKMDQTPLWLPPPPQVSRSRQPAALGGGGS